MDSEQVATNSKQSAADVVMREALEKCRDKFAEYATLHLAKGTRDGILKAQTNADMANLVCGAALSAAAALPPHPPIAGVVELREALERIAHDPDVSCLAGNPDLWPNRIAASALASADAAQAFERAGLPAYGDWLPNAWDQYIRDLVGREDAAQWARLPATFRWSDFHECIAAAIRKLAQEATPAATDVVDGWLVRQTPPDEWDIRDAPEYAVRTPDGVWEIVVAVDEADALSCVRAMHTALKPTPAPAGEV